MKDLVSRVAQNNRLMPGVVIQGDVSVGTGNFFGPGVVIDADSLRDTTDTAFARIIIGDNNYFAPGVILGAPSRQRFPNQHRTVKICDSPVIEIGSNNIVQEHTVVYFPIRELTLIGNGVFVGAHVCVAHDCLVSDFARLTAGAALGGYVALGYAANIGLGVKVRQRTTIGGLAMVGAGAVVTKDIPPGQVYVGVPARRVRLNNVGIGRFLGDHTVEYFRNAVECDDQSPQQVQELYQWFERRIYSIQENLTTRSIHETTEGSSVPDFITVDRTTSTNNSEFGGI